MKIAKILGFIILLIIIFGLINTINEKNERIQQLEYELDWAIAEKLEILEDYYALEEKINDLEK